jgi:hypothetical protein
MNTMLVYFLMLKPALLFGLLLIAAPLTLWFLLKPLFSGRAQDGDTPRNRGKETTVAARGGTGS